MMSIKAGNKDIANYLLDHGANVNTPNTSKVTPLMAAAYNGDLDMVVKLLAKNADVHAVDQLKKTAIVYAAGNGHAEVVGKLLDHGVEVNARYKNELTALMWAAGSGHAKTVALLLQRGADPDLKDDREKTALQMADEAGHLARDGRDDHHLGLSGRNQMAIALAHPELSFPGNVADRLRQRQRRRGRQRKKPKPACNERAVALEVGQKPRECTKATRGCCGRRGSRVGASPDAPYHFTCKGQTKVSSPIPPSPIVIRRSSDATASLGRLRRAS